MARLVIFSSVVALLVAGAFYVAPVTAQPTYSRPMFKTVNVTTSRTMQPHELQDTVIHNLNATSNIIITLPPCRGPLGSLGYEFTAYIAEQVRNITINPDDGDILNECAFPPGAACAGDTGSNSYIRWRCLGGDTGDGGTGFWMRMDSNGVWSNVG